jgi:hypothetical protein
VSYWSADEQSGINGALHILKEKSLFGLRNEHTLYYGPVLAVFAVPAAVVDFGFKYITGAVSGPEAYKDSIVWDWGGILVWSRLTATLVGYTSLIAVFLLFCTFTINPSQTRWTPYVATVVFASGHLFFEYMGFFRHWVFIITFLLWQLYLAIRIVEVTENTKKLWVLQAALTVASFGISYLSAMYQLFWLPLLYMWIRARDWVHIRTFAWYLVGVVVGAACMIWWHPYAFVRILGLVGILEPTNIAPVLDLAVQESKKTSFYFYAHVVFFELLPLFALVGILTAYLKKRVFEVGNGYVLWMLFIPALANYLVFSIPTLHTVRYMFPTVVLLILFACVLFSYAVSVLGVRHVAIRTSYAIIGIFVLMNSVQIVGWLRMVHAGPAERSTIVPQVLAWQAEKPGTNTLLIKNWPLGYVHTHDAYVHYVSHFNKSSYDLWQYILTLNPPEGSTPINVYYKHYPYMVTEEDYAEYDHIVMHSIPATSADIIVESPEDEVDYWPWHVWQYTKYQELYEIIK